MQRELLILEEQEGSINFKFGIVYSKHGQLTDDEMLSNEHGSPEFEKFINLIGDKIRLKGWKKYKGGLDTTSKCFLNLFLIKLILLITKDSYIYIYI